VVEEGITLAMTSHEQTSAPLPSIPDVTLHAEIARGGMGVVYRGRQDFLDREVAVKLLSQHLEGERFAARFRREAYAKESFGHMSKARPLRIASARTWVFFTRDR
jgi:serine/threonine-protein kinase